MKFYIAEGESREKLLKLYELHGKFEKACEAFRKKHKAKAWVRTEVGCIGLVFKEHPGNPAWKPSAKSNVSNHYIPTNSKEGRAARAEMKAISPSYSSWNVAEALKVQPFFFGRRFTAPKFVYWEPLDLVVVGLDSESREPKDCRRISDLEYEDLWKKVQASRKKKGKAKKAKQ